MQQRACIRSAMHSVKQNDKPQETMIEGRTGGDSHSQVLSPSCGQSPAASNSVVDHGHHGISGIAWALASISGGVVWVCVCVSMPEAILQSMSAA